MYKPDYFSIMMDGDVVTIFIYGMIGIVENEDGKHCEAASIVPALMQMSKEFKRCNIRIKSKGGLVDEGVAFMNAIRTSSMEIHTYNDGICVSMAFPIWACVPKDRRHASKDSMVMSHPPMSPAFGNYKDLEKAASKMRKYADTMASVLAESLEMDEEQVKEIFLSGDDTWFTYKEMVDMNLVDPEDAESYVAEDIQPVEEEKKAYAQLTAKITAQNEAELVGMEDARIAAMAKTIISQPVQNSEKMDKDTLIQSIREGKLSREDVTASLEATKSPIDAQSEQITALQDQVGSLTDTVTALLDKLSSTPAATATHVATPEGDQEEDAITALQREVEATIASGSRPFIAE